MFFRREKPVAPTFDQRLARLREHGFQVERLANGRTRVSRGGCAAEIAGDGDLPRVADAGDLPPVVARAGVLVGGEIGLLIDRGYQKTFRTPAGREVPALADHLKALHAFQEDLKEGLGLKSLYNESLGTVNDLHLYDRVTGRDAAPVRRPWER
jgi:hypothetical protein